MNKTDIIALATFIATYENLQVNYKILQSNLDRNQQEVKQEQLLGEIISLLKEKNSERII